MRIFICETSLNVSPNHANFTMCLRLKCLAPNCVFELHISDYLLIISKMTIYLQ
jgi:hypothetical protein